MSEGVVSSSDNSAMAPSALPQISGGAMLRQAREAAGLHIAALAVSLKVPVKKLEALEADQLDLLPDIVFVRALAASVCRALKIDSAPILERLPHTIGPRLKTDETGINTPFRTTGHSAGFVLREQLTKPFSLAVLILLIGALTLIFVPFPRKVDIAKAAKLNGSAVSVAGLSPLVAQSGAESVQQGSSSVAPLVEPVISPPVAPRLTESLNTGAGNTQLPVVNAVAGVPKNLVVFKAHGISWVEVVDASGTVQLRKTMADGETLEASGALPLAVVVGRADTIEVQVRGQVMDLKQLAKENVARFEVR